MSNTTVFNFHWKISDNQIIGHLQKSYFLSIQKGTARMLSCLECERSGNGRLSLPGDYRVTDEALLAETT